MCGPVRLGDDGPPTGGRVDQQESQTGRGDHLERVGAQRVPGHVGELLTPEPEQLGRRLEPDLIVAEDHLTRRGQRPCPPGGSRLGRPTVRSLPRPTPEQNPLVLDQRLRCVERGAGVQRSAAAGTVAKTITVPAEVADEIPDAAEHVVAPQRQQQHPGVTELEQARTLPQVGLRSGRRDRVGGGQQRTEVAPVGEVVTTVEQQLR